MSTGHRHVALWVVIAAAALIGGSTVLYGVRATAGITAAFGSSAIVVIVLAHLGVLAGVIAPLLAWRRRRRDKSSQAIGER